MGQINKKSRLNLAPEIQVGKEERSGADNYDQLFFKESIDSQLANHPRYTQKSVPHFDFYDAVCSYKQCLELEYVVLDVPAVKVSKRVGYNGRDDVTGFFFKTEHDGLSGIDPKANYALDHRKTTSLYLSNSTSITCRLTTEDPLSGHVMKLLDDLIYKKERYDWAEAIKKGELAVLGYGEAPIG